MSNYIYLIMDEDIKYQYLHDFLSIVIDKKINFNKQSLSNIISSELKQILKEIVDCDEYDMLNLLVNYVGICEKKIIDEIYQIQYVSKSYTKFGLIDWMYKNNFDLFGMYIVKIKNGGVFYDLINDFNILQLFYNMIIHPPNNDIIQYKNTFINNVVKIFTNHNCTQKPNNIFLNFEHLEMIIDICLLDEKIKRNEFKFIVIDIVLINKFADIKILKKTIEKFNLTSEEIKTHFDNKNSIKNSKIIEMNHIYFLNEIIKSKSIDKISWFFEIIPDYSKFVTGKNYEQIFAIACQTKNIEISKYIYNIIMICGFEISKPVMMSILHNLIIECRWNMSSSTNVEQIIFELINLGIKPPTGYPKYREYYNNLKFYSKK